MPRKTFVFADPKRTGRPVRHASPAYLNVVPPITFVVDEPSRLSDLQDTLITMTTIDRPIGAVKPTCLTGKRLAKYSSVEETSTKFVIDLNKRQETNK